MLFCGASGGKCVLPDRRSGARNERSTEGLNHSAGFIVWHDPRAKALAIRFQDEPTIRKMHRSRPTILQTKRSDAFPPRIKVIISI
jgi:hypothetical protein